MKKLTTLVLGIFIISAILSPIVSKAEVTAEQLQAQITSLLAQIKQLQTQLTELQGKSPNFCHTFNTNLRIDTKGDEVTALQTALTKEGFALGGNASFDESVASAVVGFQEKYRDEVLTPASLAHGTGLVGARTRAKLNLLYGCGHTTSAITVLAPNGGESWQIGSAQIIKWNTPLTEAPHQATYVDISLIPYYQPCTDRICPMQAVKPAMYPYRAPYTIATNVSIDQHSFDWRVGTENSYPSPLCDPIPLDLVTHYPNPIPNLDCGGDSKVYTAPVGQYTLQICVTGTKNCDTSDAPFTISSKTSTNLPPVINGLDAPTTLAVGQTGTWTVKATDPENGQLNYGVAWGDETSRPIYSSTTGAFTPVQLSQNATFTHSYLYSGKYTAKFKITDSAGLSAETSATVVVTGTSQPTVTVTSPNGGENWIYKSVHQITWKYANATPDSKVDLYLTNTSCPQNIDGSCLHTVVNLDKNISANAVYNWIVGTDVADKPIAPGNYDVSICVAGTSNCDYSDSSFTITAPTTTTQPAISSISQSSGPVGTLLELRGQNLSGFEGDLQVIFERSDGKTVILNSLVPYSTGNYAPTNTTLIKVAVKSPCERGQTVYGAYSGIKAVCDYFEFTPGVYKVYVNPWGVKSNVVNFTLLPETNVTI